MQGAVTVQAELWTVTALRTLPEHLLHSAIQERVDCNCCL